MDSLQQRVEGERAVGGNDDLAIEDKHRDGDLERGLHKLGKITRQRLSRLRLQLDLVAVAEQEAAEAVPLRLILPVRSGRDFVDRARFHRREGEPQRKSHGCHHWRSPRIHGGDAKTITQTAGVSAGRCAQLLSGDCSSGRRHTAVVIHCSSFCFGAAPIWREASWPPLKIISVGIDWMPYLAAVCGFSSTLSLTIFTLPLSVPAISSRARAIILPGPHHSAQESTATGPVAFNASDSKVASETLPTAMGPTSFLLVEAKRLAWEGEAMDALGQRQGGFTGR